MIKGDLNVNHLFWHGIVALHTAHRDGRTNRYARAGQPFLTRSLATAEKQRRFSIEIAIDISWLLKEGRERPARRPAGQAGVPLARRERQPS